MAANSSSCSKIRGSLIALPVLIPHSEVETAQNTVQFGRRTRVQVEKTPFSSLNDLNTFSQKQVAVLVASGTFALQAEAMSASKTAESLLLAGGTSSSSITHERQENNKRTQELHAFFVAPEISIHRASPGIAVERTFENHINTLTRLETDFGAHRLCACEFEPSDLYALREITLVGRLLSLFCTIDMVSVANNLKTSTVTI